MDEWKSYVPHYLNYNLFKIFTVALDMCATAMSREPPAQRAKRCIAISSDEEDDPEDRPTAPPLKWPREEKKAAPPMLPKERQKAAPPPPRDEKKAMPGGGVQLVSEAEVLQAAERCRRDVLTTFPEYKATLRGVQIEVSLRMQSSGAKTVFDASTLRPRCVRISMPIFSVRSNFTALADVMRHELAHAIAGREAAHGPEWQRVCKRIGGSASLGHSLCCGGEQQPPREPAPPRPPQPRARNAAQRPTSSSSSSAGPAGRKNAQETWRSAADSIIGQLIRF